MDLKPENILVTHNVAKISDLGCAVKMEGTRHVMNRHNGGTAVYRPPEMFHGEGFDSTVMNDVGYFLKRSCSDFRVWDGLKNHCY